MENICCGFLIRDKSTPQRKNAYDREHKDHRNDKGFCCSLLFLLSLYIYYP